MNSDYISINESLDEFFQDAQDHLYRDSTTASSNPPSFHTMTSPLSRQSVMEYDMEIEQDMSLLSIETVCMSIIDDNISINEEQKQQQVTNTLSEDCLSPTTSTPSLATVVATVAHSNNHQCSESEIENALFQNIQMLVQQFLDRPNRQYYPYYRVMRFIIDKQWQQLEYALTVIINRPTIILE
jgi:hypothetical protein